MKLGLLSLVLISNLYSQNTTKIQDISSLSLTIYNNIAMVNEERNMYIKNDGKQKLIYEGIASSVIFESVIPYFSKNTQLYSQNYHYDILSLNKLLEKHINKKIVYKKQISEFKYKEETAILLAVNPILLKKGNRIISDVEKSDIIFSQIPKDLLTKPSLVWNTYSKKGKQKIKLNYLTNNISWKSDYILNLDDTNSLNAWITIKNNSGTQYKDANIYCIAGEVNTKKNTPRLNKRFAMTMMNDSMEIKAKAFAGYHLYKIPFKETINNNEKKQINFISKKDIKTKSIAQSTNSIYFHRFQNILNQSFAHQIRLTNNKKDGLGIVLPKGVVRVYKEDENISHFIGMDNIKHTSLNEDIVLNIGKYSDIKQTITQEKYKKTKSYIYTQYSRLIENKTNKEQNIEIKENLYMNNIKSISNNNNCKNSCSFSKEGLNTYKYTIKLKANSTYKLNVDYKLKYDKIY